MLDFLKKLKMKRPAPEDSVPFRVTVMLTVMTGIIAVLHLEEWPGLSIPVILFTALGFFLSHIWRYKKNTALKILLAILMIVALFDFLKGLRMNPLDPRIPLSNLLLWLQTLHSYDLPTRRDLNYSLLVGLILIGTASVLSIDNTILVYFALFLVFGTSALMYNNNSRFNLQAENRQELKPALVLRSIGIFVLLMVMFTFLVLIFIPRFESLAFRPLPRSWVINLPRFNKGKVVNPGQQPGESLRGKTGSQLTWNPNSYFGFNSYVNLNFRGQLSSEEVMKVQSNKWAYIRGLAFDLYDGQGWQVNGEEEEDFEEIFMKTPPYRLVPDPEVLRHWNSTEEVVQVFHIRREMPNIIFGAYEINMLYFPSESIFADKNGGLRSPYPLEDGMVYSSISHYVPLTSDHIRRIENNEKYLRRATQEQRERIFRRYPGDFTRYTQLPENLPGRIRSFTRQILLQNDAIDGSALKKTMVLSNYLQKTYPYDLEIPPFPPGKDTVDYFLFEQKRGYCEHFASALTVMLRSQGIPARMIFGYLPGEYDIVSGMYSVKQSDAHAWVEVYVPSYGWYAVDPTPGSSGTTFSATRNQNRWLFLAIYQWIKEKVFHGVIPFRTMGFLAAGAFLIYLLVLLILIYRKENRKHPESKKPFFKWLLASTEKALKNVTRLYTYRPRPVEHPAVQVYKAMVAEFQKKGMVKTGSMTAREFVSTLVPPVLAPEAADIVSIFESARYSTTPPAEDDMEQLNNIWMTLQKKIREYKREK